MKKPTRTPLTETQVEDAERLRAIYQLRVRESKERGDSPPLNQTEIGERCEWKSPQSMVSQYINAHVALNLDALVKLSRVLDFEPAEVSPTLASGIARATEIRSGTDRTDAPAANTPFPAGGDAEATEDRYAHIPQYSAKAAAGFGHENPHVETVATLAFKLDWLRTKGVKADNLFVMYADGDSMWPTVDHHDVLLVDTSRTEATDGHVFVLTSTDRGSIVKRLVQSPLGGWIIRSDNEDKDEYPDLLLSRSEVNEHRIIGRVIWRGGDL